MTKLLHIYTRKNSAVKKYKTIDIDNNMKSFVVLKKLLQVKNQTQEHILHDSIYMKS